MTREQVNKKGNGRGIREAKGERDRENLSMGKRKADKYKRKTDKGKAKNERGQEREKGKGDALSSQVQLDAKPSPPTPYF